MKHIFFDLDGTLCDTAEDLGAALNYALKKNNLPQLPHDVIRHVVSDGAIGLIKLGFKFGEEHPDYTSVRQEILDYYLNNISRKTQLFPGVNDLLVQLKCHDILWGIVTNKPWLYTQPLIDAFKFPESPSCIICPDHVTHRKPAPDALLLACQQTGCKTSEAIYIGDHIRDIECANNANMKTIAVGYGYISEDDDYRNWPADYFSDTPTDIWPIIKERINTE